MSYPEEFIHAILVATRPSFGSRADETHHGEHAHDEKSAATTRGAGSGRH
jgi:hypothetical protein